MPRNANAVAIDWLYAMRPSLSLIWIGATLLLIVGIKRYAQSSKTVTMKITRIFVHPIKSCRGTSVMSSEYTPQGLKYDRMFVIIDKETHNMITARDIPKMVLIHPQVHPNKESPTGGTLEIRFPEESGIDTIQTALRPNDEYLDTWPRLQDVQIWKSTTDAHICTPLEGTSSLDPSLAFSKYLGRDVLLVYKGRTTRYFTSEPLNLKGPTAFQDGYPILVATEESLRDVQAKVELSASGAEGWGMPGVVDGGWNGEIVMERFRPNIVLEGAGTAYAEEEWEQIGFHRGVEDEEHNSDGGASSLYGRMVCISRCTRCRDDDEWCLTNVFGAPATEHRPGEWSATCTCTVQGAARLSWFETNAGGLADPVYGHSAGGLPPRSLQSIGAFTLRRNRFLVSE